MCLIRYVVPVGKGRDEVKRRSTVDEIYGKAGTERVDIEEVEESLGYEGEG